MHTAPDLIYLNGQYYLYYAIANAQNACAIGLVTSPTLNPKSADYKWTDRGLVVSNNSSATYHYCVSAWLNPNGSRSMEHRA